MENGNINLDDFYNYGFKLIKVVDRSEWMNKNILPEKILSASSCICDQYPDLTDLFERKKNTITNYLMNKEKEGKFIYCNFIHLEDIKEFKNKFYNNIDNLKIISLNIHIEDYKKINFKDDLLDKRLSVDKTGKILGLEIIGYENGCVSYHSYICNGLERYYEKEFGFKLNKNGFINSLEEGRKLSDYSNENELGEPVHWLPMLLIEYEDTFVNSNLSFNKNIIKTVRGDVFNLENNLKETVETMEDYLESVGEECGYSKRAIIRFNKISKRYIERTQKSNTLNDFTKISIDYIKKLNNLNKKCDYELIQTDQKELIVSMIFDIAKAQNINIEIEEDFTLDYREW